MADEFWDFFNFLMQRHRDHDWVDNLNSRIICISALSIGFLLFTSEYGARSIECYEKAIWKESWIEYANDWCFIEGSYFVNLDENLPPYSQQPQSKKVSLYQWTPFIYILIALMFHLPRMFWSAVNSSSHMYLKELAETSLKSRDRKHKNYAKRYEQIAMVKRSIKPANSCVEKLWRYLCKRYLIFTYFIVKLWNIVNVIGAHILICMLVAENSYDPFGYKAFFNIIWYGVGWKTSGVFPRVTTCELSIRQYDIGKFDRIKREQVQCFLSAHNYIEKLFIATWIISAALFIVNVYSLFRWIWKIVYSDEFIVEMIEIFIPKHKRKETFERRLLEFKRFLLPDAKFIYLMVAEQAPDARGGKIVAAAWTEYDIAQNAIESGKF